MTQDQRQPLFENHKWITLDDLAARLSLGKSTIYKLMAADGLPHLKVGRAVRFSLEEVSAWLSKRKRP